MVLLRLPAANAPLRQNFWIVWNIGQGQWVTHVLTDECLHFDAGGEPGTFKKMRAQLITNCGRKQNKLLLSHWDMDHFLHIPFLAKTIPRLCWQFKPRFGAGKASVQKILNLKIKNCSDEASIRLWTPEYARTTNDSSSVFISDSVLLPGDSPTAQEKVWSKNLPAVKVLILGHHGSRTSTGDELLSRAPELSWAVSSARWVKYRHPHEQTLQRLYKKNIPVLRTEDWGHILFEN